MRTAQLDLATYDTDKVTSGYLTLYEELFSQLVDQPIHLLEIGIRKGGSLRLWRDYFPRATIVGIDIEPPQDLDLGERVHIYRCRQEDGQSLRGVARASAPDGFDVIIDDASHEGSLTKTCFWALFDDHLKPGALYVIEDWGTGYWEDWIDGRAVAPHCQGLDTVVAAIDRLRRRRPQRFPSHQEGMVGFVKQLVDEQGAADVTRRRLEGPYPPIRPTRFASLTFYPGLVVVRKRR